ncbi:hypothetical protein BSKO_09265 [Bryopsis sp. KO-2023]|nr:hypothetical protein BSKO_09265 [Bryopsis sp. KO-2023]
MNEIKQGKDESRGRRFTGPPLPFKDGILTESEYDNRMMVATTKELYKLFFSPEFEAWQRNKRMGVENTPVSNAATRNRRRPSLWLISAISSIFLISGLYSAYSKNSLGGRVLPQTPFISLPLITSMASLVTSQQLEQPAPQLAGQTCGEGGDCGVPSRSEEECTGSVGLEGSGGGVSERERIEQLEEALKYESQVSLAWKSVAVMLMSTWLLTELCYRVGDFIPLMVSRAIFKK